MARLKQTTMFLLLFTIACTSGNCRDRRDKQTFIDQTEDLPEFLKKKDTPDSLEDLKQVKVYKSDGSLQCGQAPSIPLAEMEKELISKNIKVFQREHKQDGMMHMQVCGAATGMVNIYTIQQNDLEKALELGFKTLP